MTRVISWNTHKTTDGYAWRVYSFAYDEPTETLKTGTVKTRAIATRLARQWTLYLKERNAMIDKSQVDEKTRAKIERFARGREWRLMQARPDDYLIVVGKDDVYAIKRAA